MSDTVEGHPRRKREEVRKAIEGVLGGFTPFVCVFDNRDLDGDFSDDTIDMSVPNNQPGYVTLGLAEAARQFVSYENEED